MYRLKHWGSRKELAVRVRRQPSGRRTRLISSAAQLDP
jgi:hypothetical protein